MAGGATSGESGGGPEAPPPELGRPSASFSPYLASYAELIASPRRTAAGSGERRPEQAKPCSIQITGHEDRKKVTAG